MGSSSIESMDREAKTREAKLSLAVEAAAKMPEQIATKAMLQSQKMMKKLLKDEHRKSLKARALKESQRVELEQGIRSVEKGDSVALTRLMQKMEAESKSKSLQAKTKGFLY